MFYKCIGCWRRTIRFAVLIPLACLLAYACGDESNYYPDESTPTEQGGDIAGCAGQFVIDKIACTAEVSDPDGHPSYEPYVISIRLHDYAQSAVDDCFDRTAVLAAYVKAMSELNSLKSAQFSAQIWSSMQTIESRFLNFLIDGLGFTPFPGTT